MFTHKTAIIVQAGGKATRYNKRSKNITSKVFQSFKPSSLSEGQENLVPNFWYSTISRIYGVASVVGIKKVYITVPEHNKLWADEIKSIPKDAFFSEHICIESTGMGWMQDLYYAVEQAYLDGYTEYIVLFGDLIPPIKQIGNVFYSGFRNILMINEKRGDHFVVCDSENNLISYEFKKDYDTGRTIIGWKVSYELLSHNIHSNMEELILATTKDWKVTTSSVDIVNLNNRTEKRKLTKYISKYPTLYGHLEKTVTGLYPLERVIELIPKTYTELKHIKTNYGSDVFTFENNWKKYILKIYTNFQQGSLRFKRDLYCTDFFYPKRIVKYGANPIKYLIYEYVEGTQLIDKLRDANYLEFIHKITLKLEEYRALDKNSSTAINIASKIDFAQQNYQTKPYIDFPIVESSLEGEYIFEKNLIKNIYRYFRDLGLLSNIDIDEYLTKYSKYLENKPMVFSHGDFSPYNIIVDKTENILLIDHEWSKFTYAESDIANFLLHIFQCNLTLEKKKKIINYFVKNVSYDKEVLHFFLLKWAFWNAWYHKFISSDSKNLNFCINLIEKLVSRDNLDFLLG